MTIYFREHDWQQLKDRLHQLQRLTGENSDMGQLVDECLEILEDTDRDEAMEELQQEKAIAAKKNPSKTGGEGGDYWIA